MAKMFYTMEETKAALGRSEEEIKTLSREGKLREFRDGPRLMFKADQVDSLKGTLGARDTIDVADSGAPISLADSRSGSSSGIGLAGESKGPMSLKDDTSVGEIGLSGSFGGVPSPRSARSGSGTGVNIFNPDEVDASDPSAATAITSNDSAAGGLEATGSGSGLLDLTRESDDTSLGAVLDEIQPGKRDSGASKGGSAIGMAAAVSSTPMSSSARAQPMLIQRPDAMAPLFGGLAAGAAILCLFALFILASAVNGAPISFLPTLADKGLLVIAGGGALLVLITGGIGFALGKVAK